MSHLRQLSFPLEHLIAELAAFPLASESSLSHGSVSVAWRLEKGTPTSLLWRDAERQLLNGHPAVSIDELVAWRDRLWYAPQSRQVNRPQSVNLGEYLQNLAHTYLKHRGSDAVPCLQWDRIFGKGLDHDHFRKPVAREAWRWLTFALPPDLLLAALGNDRSIPNEVETLAAPWAQQLADLGYAETHLHLGAAIDFRLLWAATMAGIRDSDVKPQWLASPGAAFNDGNDLASFVLAAAIIRYLLGAFLAARRHDASPRYANWSEYLFGDPTNSTNDESVLGRVAREIGMLPALDLRSLVTGLATNQLCLSVANFRQWQWLYRRLVIKADGRTPEFANSVFQTDRVHHSDPLSDWFGDYRRGVPTPEMQFVTASLTYLKDNPSDHEFAILFWQVIRVRCLFYRHVVLRPMTPGLQYFVRTYDRMSAPRRRISVAAQVESATHLCGLGQGLRSLEIRTSPFADVTKGVEFLEETRRSLRGYAKAQSQEIPELGVVFHFIKHRGGGWEQGCPNAYGLDSHAEPSFHADLYSQDPADRERRLSGRPISPFRFSAYYSKRLRETQAVARMMTMYPLTLSVLRGIDICTDEAGVPSWVFVSPMRYLRDVSCRVSEWLWNLKGWKIPPLRTTVHVGEDFVYLLSGLRRVDESLRFLGLREGDRLGHAVALGTNPSRWVKSAGQVNVSRDVRLWDLVWEWTQYAREGIPCRPGREMWIRRHLERLTALIFERENITPWDLEMAYELLHDERALGELGFPFGQVQRHLPQRESLRTFQSCLARRGNLSDMSLAEECLRSYLSSPDTFRRSQELEVIDSEEDLAALETRFFAKGWGEDG